MVYKKKAEHKFCCTNMEGLSVKNKDFVILDDVNMHIHCGELTVIVGKNGAGKSTLLKALIGEIKHQGKITFSSIHNDSKKLTIGYVPQKLNIEESPMSVYDLIASYTTNSPIFLLRNRKKYNEIKEHLKEFEADSLIDKKVCNLSGGELQKVLIAIATMPYPELLILDEPVSGIDAKGQNTFYMLLDKIKKNHDIAILMVSHDFVKIQQYADKVYLLNKKILKSGTAEEVFKSPEFIEEFGLGGVNNANN